MRSYGVLQQRLVRALDAAPAPPTSDPLLQRGVELSDSTIPAVSLEEYVLLLHVHRQVTGLPRTDAEIVAAVTHEEEHVRAAEVLHAAPLRMLSVYKSVQRTFLSTKRFYASQEWTFLPRVTREVGALVAARPHDRSASDLQRVQEAGWDMQRVLRETERVGALPPLEEPNAALVEQVGNILADIS